MTDDRITINGTTIKKDDILTIKRGSLVKSYNPSKMEYTTVRKQKIKINHWYTSSRVIAWVGTGYYWCWTNVDNVE